MLYPVLRYFRRAEIYHPFRVKDVCCQYVFYRCFIEQLNQCFHLCTFPGQHIFKPGKIFFSEPSSQRFCFCRFCGIQPYALLRQLIAACNTEATQFFIGVFSQCNELLLCAEEPDESFCCISANNGNKQRKIQTTNIFGGIILTGIIILMIISRK